MATLTLDTAQGNLLDAVKARPPARSPRDTPAPRPRPDTPATSARTLDDLIAGAWSALAVTETTACPLCGGDLVPRFGAGPQPVAGSCRSCGTELS